MGSPIRSRGDSLHGIKVIVAEDELKDSRQKHASEQVNYIVFE